jgi:hypothetical protein
MTPADFTAWVAYMRAAHNLSEHKLVALLGCGPNQITRWKKTGAPAYIGLACAALAAGLQGWTTQGAMVNG